MDSHTKIYKRIWPPSPSLWLYIAVAAIFAVAGLFLYLNSARASGGFPPLNYLASELGVSVGQQLPKGVVYDGRPFFFYIVGAHERGNGRYTVDLQAR